MKEIKFEKYPEYKKCEVEMFSKIPLHWELLANRYIFKIKKNKVGAKNNEYDLLSLTLNGIVKRDIENPTGKFPAEFDTYQEVKKGDFVFCLFDVNETPRTVGLCEYDGMITGAYTVLEASENFDKKYLYYFYLNLDFNKRLKSLYKGLRNTIPKENFFSFKTFVPPIKEQVRIAKFLDNKCEKLNKAISQKEKLIILLNERKQIIIKNSVTKGLDKDIEIKNSGNEWFDKIPKHWELCKLRQILIPTSIKNKVHLPLLSITREKGIILRNIDDLEENHNFIPEDLSGYKMIEKGQFGMNKMKAWQGSYGISNYTGIVSPAYFIFKMIKDIEPEFFHIAIRSKIYVPFFGRASDGVRIGQWDLSKERMKEIPFIIPPRKEQIEIIRFIKEQEKIINYAISFQEKQIVKLKEYKEILIDNAVTGKIKVGE